MTISGALLADFSSYNAAVDGAVVKLRSFGEGSNRVNASLSKMTDSFSGRKVIQEATLMAEVFTRAGGASKFTSDELERMGRVGAAAMAKLQASGVPVPPGIARIAQEAKGAESSLGSMVGIAGKVAGAFGIAFSVGAIVSWGNAVLDTADKLVATSDRTKLLVDDIQRLEYIGGQSGNTLDELTASISKMQLNLNDPKARAAFRDLNIDIAELTAARPFEQFEMIAESAGKIEDPVQLAEIAVAIFGKRGIEIIPTLRAKFKELSDEVTTSGDQQVRALERLGDALSRQKTNFSNYVEGYVGGIALVAEKVGWLEALALRIGADFGGTTFGAIEEEAAAAAAAVEEVSTEVKPAVDVLADYREQLDAVGASVDNLSESERALIEYAVGAGQSATEIATAMNLAVPIVERYAATVKEAATAADQARKLDARAEAQGAETVAKLWGEYYDLRKSESGTTTDKLVADIERWYAAQVAAAQKAGTDTIEFYSALEAVSRQKLNGLAVIDPQGKSRESMQALADAALAEFNRMTSSGLTYSREVLDAQMAKYRALQDAVRNYGRDAVASHRESSEAARAELADLTKLASANRNAAGGTKTYNSLEEVLAATDLTPAARDQLVANFTKDQAVDAPAITAPPGGYNAGANVTVPVNVTGTSARDIGQQVEAALVKDAKFKKLMGGGRA